MKKSRKSRRSNLRLVLSLAPIVPVLLFIPFAITEESKETIVFDTQRVSKTFYAEGAAWGDFNRDDVQDIVSGAFWYEGPDFEKAHELYPPDPVDVMAYSDNFFSFTHDFNGDEWTDVLVFGFPGAQGYWLENPGEEGGHWEKHIALDGLDNESPQWVDINGDGQRDMICSQSGYFGYASPNPDAPEEIWKFHRISTEVAGGRFTHGLGVGDVNGDGRMDLLEKNGWWEQPESLEGDPVWAQHSFPFSGPGGAQMYAYDFDGDGDNDILTSEHAHGYGLLWYEQIEKDGEMDFVKHRIMGETADENEFGVCFSQLHAIDLVDIDGDGMKDIITGKRWYAHGGNDIGGKDPAVIYWFRTVPSGNPGEVTFIPHFIDDDSGVGTEVKAGDINGDGLTDILVGNKKGTFVHLQRRAEVDAEGFRPIFDGETLEGWEGDMEFWAVEDGAITGEWTEENPPDGNTFLFWKAGRVADFELRLKYRIGGDPSANSGIQFRSVDQGDFHAKGYQADLEGGPVWLGRIYDENGRALLVDRGQRVLIAEDGQRVVETFATPEELMEGVNDGDWNDYSITASGTHITVKVNGKVFSQLVDRQEGERDLYGRIAFQLHRMAPVKVQYKDIRLKELLGDSDKIDVEDLEKKVSAGRSGSWPKDAEGNVMNMGFEDGTLKDWTVEGSGFEGMPVKGDLAGARRADMPSKHDGQYWIGGFEKNGDAPTGTLTSKPFKIDHPWGSYLIAGGPNNETRVEIVKADSHEVVHTAIGLESETLDVVVLDFKDMQGQEIYVRLVDEHTGHWGHLNFDDFRFHEEEPEGRVIPQSFQGYSATDAVSKMELPEGFNASVIASEPDLRQPIAFTIDDRGRLWVVEGNTYPVRAEEGEGRDRILIFEDTNSDGNFDTRKVFLENLNLVSGIEVGFGGVWIGAAPYLLFIPDRDGDDVPDGEPEILLDGWGYHDTHETLNAFIWGPDGWLYGCHGVFTHSRVGKPGTPDEDRVPLNCAYWRYHPTKHEFEVFAQGTSNPWGLDFNDYGQAFASACVIPHFWHVIQGAYYLRQSNPLGHFNPYVYENIETIADHLHYIGNNPHAGNNVSDEAGGGHAHCGLTVYLGDSFPDEYRNRPLFFNLHGHRVNQETLVRSGSGYVAQHEPDFVKMNDPWFMGVAVKYGPDGSLFMIDWYDEQTCHRTLPEIWNRTNGRLYNIAYGEREGMEVDLGSMPDSALVRYQRHENDWFVRTARRILQERHAEGKLDEGTIPALKAMLQEEEDVPRKLRALWALHVVEGLEDNELLRLTNDASEYVRAWSIQLLLEDGEVPTQALRRFAQMSRDDESAMVRLYLASALQRLEGEARWAVAEGLASHSGDADDHNLPQMIWYGVEPLVADDPERALAFAEKSALENVTRYVARRAAVEDSGLVAVLEAIASSEDIDRQLEWMSEVRTSLRGRSFEEPPAAWNDVYEALAGNRTSRVQNMLEALAVGFGDKRAFPKLRRVLADRNADQEERENAYRILTEARDEELPPILMDLLEEEGRRLSALKGLSLYNNTDRADELLKRFHDYSVEEQRALLSALANRADTAKQLLDAIGSQKIAVADVPSFIARQIKNLGNDDLTEQLNEVWGLVGETPDGIAQEMERYKTLLTEEFLAEANVSHGRALYAQTCQACHTLFGEGNHIGPDLTGSNRGDLDYLLENILDPNALVGKDYQLNVLTLKDGGVVSGMVREETERGYQVQLLDTSQFVAKDDVASRQVLEVSMMAPGMLTPLSDEDTRDLIAYLGSPEQVPLGGEKSEINSETGRVDGAIEGESLKIGKRRGEVSFQGMSSYTGDQWSGDRHLWWTGARPNDELELKFPVKEDGQYEIQAVLTKAPDYGIVQLKVDGENLGGPIDLFSRDGVITTGLLSLGTHELEKGEQTLTVQITGAHPDAIKNYMFGIDYLLLHPTTKP